MSDLTVFNWEVHENLATQNVLLQKVKEFAVACGWTCSKEQISKQWGSIGGGQYGWVTGTEDFIELKSNGFGSQNLIFRLRMQDATWGFWIRGHKYDTYNLTSATHPVDINGTSGTWSNGYYQGKHDIRRTNIPAIWLFGNEKVIFIVIKYDSLMASCIVFGSLKSFYSAETELDWTNRGTTNWAARDVFPAMDESDGVGGCAYGVYYRGTNRYGTLIVMPNFFSSAGNIYSNLMYFSHSYAIRKNSYSSIRPIYEQVVYFKDSDNLWFAGATPWVGRLITHGLEIGEHIKYGTEEYICFPWREVTSHHAGYCFRIN